MRERDLTEIQSLRLNLTSPLLFDIVVINTLVFQRYTIYPDYHVQFWNVEEKGPMEYWTSILVLKEIELLKLYQICLCNNVLHLCYTNVTWLKPFWAIQKHNTYRVCHWFRLRKRDDYFWVIFDHFWSKPHFFEADGAVVKIGLSLKPYYNNQV